jgi:formate hydrogenlyase subunit 3/multisubunit Na+/H+ antiporter MnhD subunit
MTFFIAGLSIIALGALVSLFLPQRLKTVSSFGFISAGAALCSFTAAKTLISGETASASFSIAHPFGTVQLAVDPLSAFFILLIAAGSVLSAMYACGYLAPYVKAGRGIGAHLFFYHSLIGSMFLLVAVNHSLFFMLVWEIMSLSSLVLILFEREKKDVVSAGVYYATAMHIGAACLLGGFTLCAAKTGGYDISAIDTILSGSGGTSRAAYLLLIIGFAVKAGFLPFHSWLPRAHPAAPSHVSALMSGVMIKMGIYGIIRTLSLSGTPDSLSAAVFIAVAIVTAIFGVLSALVSRDMKRLLAYSSIENIGIIGCGIGGAMLSLAEGNTTAAHLVMTGVFIFIFSHMLAKSALFFSAGTVYLHTHTRDMEQLGGLALKAPFAAAGAFLASGAVCALPPFSLFAGELLMIGGFASGMSASSPAHSAGMIAIIAVFGLVGAMALFAFTKFTAIPFLGQQRTEITVHGRVSSFMNIAMMIPPAILLACGLFPQALYGFFSPVIQTVSGSEAIDSAVQTASVLESLSRAVTVFAAAAGSVLLIRFLLLRKRRVVKRQTWGCGYKAANPRVQYTGHSFVQPFLAVTGSLAGLKHRIERPRGFFPKAASFSAKGIDTVDNMILEPSLDFLDRVFKRLTEMQTGRIQIAILYGTLFIMAAISWALLRSE